MPRDFSEIGPMVPWDADKEFQLSYRMSCSLNSFKGVLEGSIIWLIKGDTRTLGV